MTASNQKHRNASVRRGISLGSGIFFVLSVSCLTLLLRSPTLAAQCLKRGLSVCVNTVIPSLFPFMVVSEMLVSGDLLLRASRLLHTPCSRLFGIGGESGCAVLMGWLCGFPVGTRCALSLYREGRIDRHELERIICFSNLPSSFFLVGSIGLSLFHSRRLGIALYLINLASAFLLGCLSKWLLPASSPSRPYAHPPVSDVSGAKIFTDAVSSSALAMLKICAFVVFFSTVLGVLEYAPVLRSLPDWLFSLSFGLFEMTGGMLRSASCSPAVSPYLCAFLSGWSGLSVHFQLISLCANERLSFLPYFLFKLLHGLLNVCLLRLLSSFIL